MVQITSPTSSVSSSSAKISLIVPLKDDGISAVTLSVKTSAIASYFSTVSPGLTNHELIVPSVTLSPNLGMVIFSTATGLHSFILKRV